VAPTLWLPIDPNPTLSPKQTYIKDTELRGSAVEVYNDVLSVRHDEYDCKGNAFADTFPALMMALLGGTDTVTGTVAPYGHSIPLLDNAATGSQPPSYTVTDVDQVIESAGAAKQMAASQLESIDLTFSATGALTWAVKWIGNPFTQVAVPTPSFSSEVFIPAYNCAVTIGTSASNVVTDGKLTFNRKTAPIFVLGQQGPFQNWAGPLEVTGSLTLVALANDPTLANALSYDKQKLIFTFTDPVSSHSLTFQMSQVQFTDPKVVRGKTYVEVETDMEAEANATDATGGGYSPVLFKATNAQSSAY
jgi:hypothetical protein